jgi:hypothetical protein
VYRLRRAGAVAYWLLVVVVYSWFTVMAFKYVRYTKALENAVGVYTEVITTQGEKVDSLEALLHIQVVDMPGFRTLCYLKLPAKADDGG